jgi:hypothetical protein
MCFHAILTILITFFVLFVIWTYPEPNTELTVKDLKIPKKNFVLMVLQWCHENLGTINHHYQPKIYYYQNKTYSGRFLSWNKHIVIYSHPDLELIELVDTIIHEYVHHLQFQKKSTEKDYNKKLTEIGYWNNPYEVEARKLAKEHKKECFDWVVKNYDIV